MFSESQTEPTEWIRAFKFITLSKNLYFDINYMNIMINIVYYYVDRISVSILRQVTINKSDFKTSNDLGTITVVLSRAYSGHSGRQ